MKKKLYFAIKYFALLVRNHIAKIAKGEKQTYQLMNNRGFYEAVSFFEFYFKTAKVIIEKF